MKEQKRFIWKTKHNKIITVISSDYFKAEEIAVKQTVKNDPIIHYLGWVSA